MIHDGKIQIFVLGLEEILVAHTSKNLKDIVLKCLARYDLFPKYIYSVTSDNAANILCMAQLMNDEYKKQKVGGLPEVNTDDDSDDIELLIQIICENDWADDNIESKSKFLFLYACEYE